MPKTNNKDLLLFWCRERGTFSKADVISWGLENFYISADRAVRHFVQSGYCKKIPKDECILRGLKGKMAWYEFVCQP